MHSECKVHFQSPRPTSAGREEGGGEKEEAKSLVPQIFVSYMFNWTVSWFSAQVAG